MRQSIGQILVSLYSQVLIPDTNQTFHAAAGSSCGAVSRVVATSTRDHWFESQHQQKHIETFANCNLLRNDELNEEEAEIGSFNKPSACRLKALLGKSYVNHLQMMI